MLLSGIKSGIWVRCAVLLVAAAALSAILIFVDNGHCIKGITVNNTDLSGLTRKQAELKLNTNIKKYYIDRVISLHYLSKTWTLDLKDICVEFCIDDALDRAFSVGKSGGLTQRLREIKKAHSDGIHINCEYEYNNKKLLTILGAIKKEVDVKAQNAGVFYKNGSYLVRSEKNGISLNLNKSIQIIDEAISSYNKQLLKLPVELAVPQVKKDDLLAIEAILSQKFTVFSTADEGRTQNIKLAAAKLNGYALLPGQVFSMDQVLGPRTAENGFREAPVIVKDDIVRSLGGGICQVTSTLYISVLLANLEIVERKPHSLSLNYVPPGQDATISQSYIDFKFKNASDYAIALYADVVENRLEIKVLGEKKAISDFTTELKSEIIEEYEPGADEFIPDPQLQGEAAIMLNQAKKGLRVIVWKETYSRGRLVSRTKVSDDIYKAVPARYKVSPGYYSRNKDKMNEGLQ